MDSRVSRPSTASPERDGREDLRHEVRAGPGHDRVRGGDDRDLRALDRRVETEPDRLRDVTSVHVAPQVPLPDRGVVLPCRELRVVGRHHDVRDAQAQEADPAAPGELARHRLADELRERVGRLGPGSMVSSIGANAGGSSNGRPSTVSLDAHTTRRTLCATAAWKTFQVETALIRKVSPSGRSPGRGIAAKWTIASAPARASRVWPRSVRSAARPGPAIAGFAADVDVEDVMAMLAQVPHDPRAALAAAARDDDPHRPTSSGQYGGRPLDQGRRAASRTGSRPAA